MKPEKTSLPRLSRYLFNKDYWFNSSTWVDYKIYLLNSLLKTFLFFPFLDISFSVSSKVVKMLSLSFSSTGAIPASATMLFIFSLFSFVFDDFCRFAHHLAMHKVPFLWRFHKLHHSATVLTPITLYRIHPIESAMATVRNSISWGCSLGVFMFFFASDFQFLSLLGINIFAFMFNILGSNLRHSHIPVSFGVFEIFFISPAQHQIHHSSAPEYFNKNFGVALSIWDSLLGSKVYSLKKKQRLQFGIGV